MNIQTRGRRHQLRIINKLLPRPFFFSFDSHEEAFAYGTQLEAILARGVVPQELLVHLQEPQTRSDPAVLDVIDEYVKNNAAASATDRELVGYIRSEFVGLRMSSITFDFALQLVHKLKIIRHLAPSSIRARIGCLGRIFDWHLAHKGVPKAANVWRLLPSGYSIASESEAKELKQAEKVPKRDQHRDRRLEEGEDDLIRRVLAGEKLLANRERGIAPDPAMAMLYSTIVDTGMRLREVYTLTVDQLDLKLKQIAANGTKGHRGALKPRNVPLKGTLYRPLKQWIEDLPSGEHRVFPTLWDGSSEKEDLKRTTGRLSTAFAKIFEHAGSSELTEHDLRHEATCRWVTMRRPDGAWLRSETEIAKILGWSSLDMFLRYASLRGADLADGLDDF